MLGRDAEPPALFPADRAGGAHRRGRCPGGPLPRAAPRLALTKAFANAIWPSYAAFVGGAASLERGTLAGRPEVAALDRDLRRLSDGLPVG
jgi:hypothetical protein